MSEKKVYYYNPIIYFNNEKTRNAFRHVIDYVNSLNINQRFQHIEDYQYALIKFREYEKKDVYDRHFCIGKYRPNGPKQGEIGTDTLEDIDNDIVEPISLYYCNTSNLLMYEYNHYGPREGALEKYFNSFLPQNQNWRIELLEVPRDFDVNEIYDSKDIKSLDIKFEQSDRLLSFIERRNNLHADNSVIFDAVQNVSDFMKNVGGNVADLKISKGRLKKNSLSNDDMKNLIDLLLPIASEIFLSLKVKYLAPSNISEVIDLVDYGKYTTIYNRDDNSDGWEYIADKIEEIYEEKYRAEIAGHNAKVFKKGPISKEKLKLS